MPVLCRPRQRSQIKSIMLGVRVVTLASGSFTTALCPFSAAHDRMCNHCHPWSPSRCLPWPVAASSLSRARSPLPTTAAFDHWHS
jgi:hypothetical protein